MSLCICGITAPALSAEPKRVLLLHSFGENFAPYSPFTASFRTDLAQQWPDPIDLYDISLLAARFPSTEPDSSLVDYLKALFSDHQLDLIVAIGGPAVQFSTEYRDRLFPSVPLLISAVDERRLKGVKLTPKDAVVPVRLEFPRAVDEIRKLLPGTKTIAMIFGHSPLEQYWVTSLREEFQASTSGIDFQWLDQSTLAQIKERVSALPPHSAILYGMLSVDAAGVPQIEARALPEISQSANAPTFGLFATQLGEGIVGGSLISSDDLAHRAADVAIEILDGKTPADISTPALEPGKPAFDWRQLQRWGISEASLPAGSTMQFRSPPLWEIYRWQFLAAAAVLLLQSLFIIWLLIERHARRAAELEARTRLVEVAHLNRAVTTGAMSSALSHELSQPLGSILANAEAAEHMMVQRLPDIGEVTEILGEIRQSSLRASEIIRHLRVLVSKGDIRREPVDAYRAIQNVVQILAPEANSRRVELRYERSSERVTVLGDMVYLEQILLNLALNAMDAMGGNTSKPRILEFQVAGNGAAMVEIAVLDSGPGVPPKMLKTIFDPFFTTKAQGTGLGLSIVRSIVVALGGQIKAENKPDGGAAFRFTLPVAVESPMRTAL